jgi:hypothetical protein
MSWSSGYKQCELHHERCGTSLGTTRLNSEYRNVELYREVHAFLTQNTVFELHGVVIQRTIA